MPARMYVPLDDTLLNQPPTVQAALLDLLSTTLQIDGVVEHREVQVLARVAQDLGDPRDLMALLNAVPDPTALAATLAPIARYALLQAAIIAVVRGSCHPQQRAFLRKLAVEMDTDPALVEQALDWALRGAQWREEGLALLNAAPHKASGPGA